MQNIYLIGFMGCGKTTLATSLSEKWQMHTLDLDQVIVQREQREIAQIFEADGEAYFRNLESKVLLNTGGLKRTIIATGGGIVEREGNRIFLKTQEVIYLKWPFEVLYARIKHDETRPLAISYEVLKERFEKRQAWYEAVASCVVICDGHTPFSLTEKLSQLYRHV